MTITQSDKVTILRDNLINTLFWVDRLVLLVNVCQLNSLTNGECTLGRLLQAHNHTEQSSLTSTVRTDNAYDTCRGKVKVKSLIQDAVAKDLLDIVSLDNHIAQAGTVGDEDFELLLLLLNILVKHLIVSRQTSLALGATARRRHTHPLQLALQSLATLRLLLLLLCQTL